MPGAGYAADDYGNDNGTPENSSIWTSLISSATQLGNTALNVVYAPKNAGAAINPSGEAAVGIRGMLPSTPSSLMSILAIGGLVLVGFFVYKKL